MPSETHNAKAGHQRPGGSVGAIDKPAHEQAKAHGDAANPDDRENRKGGSNEKNI